MPRPSLQNRTNFKTYLRHFKNKFNSTVQKLPEYWIDDLLSSKSPGISTTSDVNVILFDNKDTVAITTAVSNNELIYIPALSGDEINLSIGSSTYTFNFGVEGSSFQYNGSSYGLNDSIEVDKNKILTVKGLGGALLQPESVSYSIGVSTTILNEGDSVEFTINTIGIGSGTTLYYNTFGSTLSEDFSDNSLTGSFNIVGTGATTGVATVTRTTVIDPNNDGAEAFVLEIRTGSSSGTIVATSSTITVNNVIPPTFEVGISTTIINEGDSVEFTINSTGISTLTPIYYTTNGTVTASDFTDNSLSGSFNIVSTGATTGVATITRSLAYDFESGSSDNFSISIRTGSIVGTSFTTSSTITVNNLIPSFTIVPSTLTANEGGSVTFTVNTINVGSGTTLYYSTSGSVESADFSDNSLTGSFNIVGTGTTTGIATVTRTIAYDLLSESAETFNLIIRTGSTGGTIVATSSTITVSNVEPTYSVTPSTTSTNEGSSVTFSVTTVGVPNGSVLYWTTLQVSGTISASDFNDSALSGSFTVNNNTGTIIRSIVADRSTESTDVFKIEIRRNSITGTIIATSDSVTINDTSLNVGQYANGLTFGPVQVNRDNGNSSLASDWYTICGIDKLPEGSKIALFIDTSGSMTQATIQASYDLLVSKLAEKNISIITVTNPNEDWITPFLTDLS